MTEMWLTFEQARVYVNCPTITAWYSWRRRHGIVKRTNNTVNKADLDRALTFSRKTAQSGGGGAGNPNSLNNLKGRSASPEAHGS